LLSLIGGLAATCGRRGQPSASARSPSSAFRRPQAGQYCCSPCTFGAKPAAIPPVRVEMEPVARIPRSPGRDSRHRSSVQQELAEGYLRLGGILSLPMVWRQPWHSGKALETTERRSSCSKRLPRLSRRSRYPVGFGSAYLNLGGAELEWQADEAVASVQRATRCSTGWRRPGRGSGDPVEAGRAWRSMEC